MTVRGRLTFAVLLLGVMAVPAFAANQIMLAGQVLRKCTVEAAAEPVAADIPMTLTGSQRILIGTVTQDCNGRVGYTLNVFSTNCLAAPAGAKLVDPVSNESLSYSVESHNPTSGGSSPVVTGLLASECSDQVARDVTSAIVHNQSSSFYINYVGSSALAAGTYQDTLTITMTAK